MDGTPPPTRPPRLPIDGPPTEDRQPAGETLPEVETEGWVIDATSAVANAALVSSQALPLFLLAAERAEAVSVEAPASAPDKATSISAAGRRWSA